MSVLSTIIHQREDCLLMFKKTGIPVFFPNKGEGDSLLQMLYQQEPSRRELDWPQGFEGGIAHRLDIPTTGGVLVASNPTTLLALRSCFTEKVLKKTYWFLSAKEPRWEEHYSTVELAHHKKKRGLMIPKRGKNTPHRGKWYSATTYFRHLARYDGLSLWEAVMYSGVMHQIRCHAGFLGIALLGDKRYGGGSTPRSFTGDFALHHCQIGDWPFVSPPIWWPKWVHEFYEEVQ